MKKIYRYLDVNDVFIVLTAIFPFTTITQKLVPFSFNRIIGLLLMTLLMLELLKHMKRRQVICLYGIVVLFGVSILLCGGSKTNFESYIYWVTTILIMNKISGVDSANQLLETFCKNSNIIKIFLYLYIIVNISCLFNQACYQSYAGWGTRGYFQAYANTPHTLASTSCLFITLACLYIACIKMDFLLAIGVLVSVLSVFQSGARIFLVSVFCIAIVCAFIFFRKKFERYCFYGVGCVAFIFLFLKSGMLEKFQTVLTASANTDKVASFTNARSTIWLIAFNAMKEANIFELLLGHGFDYVAIINKIYYGAAIWAHNDFIQLIVSVGVIGLVIYLLSIIGILKNLECDNKIIKLSLIIYIVFPAFWNGLYIYQHLVYSVIYLWLICNLYSCSDICFLSAFRKGMRRKL